MLYMASNEGGNTIMRYNVRELIKFELPAQLLRIKNLSIIFNGK